MWVSVEASSVSARPSRLHAVDAALAARRDVERARRVEGERPDVLLGGIEEARRPCPRRRSRRRRRPARSRRRRGRPGPRRSRARRAPRRRTAPIRACPRSAPRGRRCRCRRRARPSRRAPRDHASGASGSKSGRGLGAEPQRSLRVDGNALELALEERARALEPPELRGRGVERGRRQADRDEQQQQTARAHGQRSTGTLSWRQPVTARGARSSPSQTVAAGSGTTLVPWSAELSTESTEPGSAGRYSPPTTAPPARS